MKRRLETRLVPVQGILQLLGPLLPGGVRRCSPEQTQLLSTARHSGCFFQGRIKHSQHLPTSAEEEQTRISVGGTHTVLFCGAAAT